MPSILIDKCCFCAPLRVGSIIIGYLLTIVEAILVCFACLSVVTIVKVAGNREEFPPQLLFILVVRFCMIFLFAIEMASSIVLVVGLHLRRRLLIKIFFVLHLILLTLFIVHVIVDIALYAKYYRTEQWLLQLPALAIILFQSYCIFIVIRYYQVMNQIEVSNQGVVYTAAKSDEP